MKHRKHREGWNDRDGDADNFHCETASWKSNNNNSNNNINNNREEKSFAYVIGPGLFSALSGKDLHAWPWGENLAAIFDNKIKYNCGAVKAKATLTTTTAATIAMAIATSTKTANQIVSQVEKSKNCNTSDGRRNFRKNFSFAVRDDAENERVQHQQQYKR